MPAMSTPSEDTWVMSSPVFASKTSAVFCGASAACHSPWAKEGKTVFSGALVVMSGRAPSLLPEGSFGYCGSSSVDYTCQPAVFAAQVTCCSELLLATIQEGLHPIELRIGLKEDGLAEFVGPGVRLRRHLENTFGDLHG